MIEKVHIITDKREYINIVNTCNFFLSKIERDAKLHILYKSRIHLGETVGVLETSTCSAGC